VLLFLDSSAVVKIYLAEPHGDKVIEAIEKADRIFVSTLALSEVAYAITRREQENSITHEISQLAYQNLLDEWESLTRIPLDDNVAREAAMLAGHKHLKGADAVQLASATLLARERKSVYF
jgi:uncharacterized protein